MKAKSAKTGKFVSKKEATQHPQKTVVVSEYSTRMLKKLIKLFESETFDYSTPTILEMGKIIVNVKKRMGWK